MESIVKSLNENYHLKKTTIKKDVIILQIESELKSCYCPYCNAESTGVHSHHVRELQDLPISNLNTVLLVSIRKMRCMNPECEHKFFSEQIPFAKPRAQKTNRLVERIITTSTEMSTICSSLILKNENIIVGKSTISNLIKKKSNQSIS